MFDFVSSLVNVVALLLDAHGRRGQLGLGRLDRLQGRLLPRRRIAILFLPVNQFVLFGVRRWTLTSYLAKFALHLYLTLLDCLRVVQLLIRLLFLSWSGSGSLLVTICSVSLLSLGILGYLLSSISSNFFSFIKLNSSFDCLQFIQHTVRLLSKKLHESSASCSSARLTQPYVQISASCLSKKNTHPTHASHWAFTPL